MVLVGVDDDEDLIGVTVQVLVTEYVLVLVRLADPPPFSDVETLRDASEFEEIASVV